MQPLLNYFGHLLNVVGSSGYGSSDELVRSELVANANLSHNAVQQITGQNLRPSGPGSRPSSRQGQKYTTAAADGFYADGVLSDRQVSSYY